MKPSNSPDLPPGGLRGECSKIPWGPGFDARLLGTPSEYAVSAFSPICFTDWSRWGAVHPSGCFSHSGSRRIAPGLKLPLNNAVLQNAVYDPG